MNILSLSSDTKRCLWVYQ